MKKALIIILVISLLFSACGKKGVQYDPKIKIAGAKGYSSIANITINGNKGISKYVVKQYCVYPDKLRVETIEPDFLKNKVVVRNNGIWRVYHPLIKQVLTISKLMDDDELILMGIVQKSMFISGDAKISETTFFGEKCISISCNIAHGNRYRKTAILYIDISKNLPIGMEILGDNGNKSVEIKYTDFVYNGDFSDSLFNLK